MKALEQAVLLRRRMRDISAAQEHEQQAAALENKRKVLEQHRKMLQAAVEAADILVRNECLGFAGLPSADDAKEQIRKTIASFAQDPSSLTRERSFSTLCGRVEKLASGISAAVTEHWIAEVKTVPKASDALLTQIEKIRIQEPKVRQLRALIAQLHSLCRIPPAKQEDWAEYQQVRKAVASGIEMLGESNFPAAVLEFCVAAQAQGAHLSLLTDEVREWLEENEMIEELRYRFK
jgi:hypothetical protein